MTVDLKKPREIAQRIRDGMTFNREATARLLDDMARELEGWRKLAAAKAKADETNDLFASIFGGKRP